MLQGPDKAHVSFFFFFFFFFFFYFEILFEGYRFKPVTYLIRTVLVSRMSFLSQYVFQAHVS